MKNILTNNIYVLFAFMFTISVVAYLMDASVLTVGGVVLILGAYYIYFGNIYFSVISYTVADICWIINAITHGDLFGSVAISLGIIVGIIVTYKIKIGVFNKSIVKDNNE